MNVHSGEIIDRTAVAIGEGRFAYAGHYSRELMEDTTKIIEAKGRYLVPGLCNGHMHVESGMLTVTEFAYAVIPHGTTPNTVVGASKYGMALAANRPGEVGGGICVYSQGRELALIELPIAGLMSDDKAGNVAAKIAALIKAMQRCGCRMHNACMQHSLLALIPELRISNLGLIDVNRFAKTALFTV